MELLVLDRRSVDISSVGCERQNGSCVFVAVLREDQHKTKGCEGKGEGSGCQISWNCDLITHIRDGSIHSVLTPTVLQRRRQHPTPSATYCA